MEMAPSVNLFRFWLSDVALIKFVDSKAMTSFSPCINRPSLMISMKFVSLLESLVMNDTFCESYSSPFTIYDEPSMIAFYFSYFPLFLWNLFPIFLPKSLTFSLKVSMISLHFYDEPSMVQFSLFIQLIGVVKSAAMAICLPSFWNGIM